MGRKSVKMEGPAVLRQPGVTSSGTGPLGGGREISTDSEGEEERWVFAVKMAAR